MAADDRWIERLVSAGSALGMNPVRLRWRLLRWRDRARVRRGLAARRMEHVAYAHKSCHACGHPQDRAAAACSRCGARLLSRRWDVLRRLGLAAPRSFSATLFLGLAVLAVYVRQWAAAPDTWGVDRAVFLQLGANVAGSGAEWWRYFTSLFLHVGLWHLAFNLIALAQVGPAVEETFGRGAMLALFLATGAVASLASAAFRPLGMAAGASGALMGLVGAAAGWGHRQGTGYGRDIRNRMLLWGLYTMLFGYFIGADNIAHGVGFAAGAVFGLLVPGPSRHAWLRGASVVLGLLAAGGVVATTAFILTRDVVRDGRASGEARVLLTTPEERAAAARAVAD